MKKLIHIGVLFLSILTLPSVSKGAGSYLDVGPYISFDVGGYSRRIMENCNNCSDGYGNIVLKAPGNGDSTRVLAKLGFRADLLDFYLTFGGANLSIDDFGYQSDMAPAFGGGFKILMYQSPSYGHFSLFLNPDVLYFKTNSTVQFYPATSSVLITENHDISWTEYTLHVGGSTRYGPFETYGGVSLSFVNGEESGPQFGTSDFNERDNVGLFLGANVFFDPSSRASIFGEIAGGDNNYFKVGIKTMF